jgi:hypothetical protein
LPAGKLPLPNRLPKLGSFPSVGGHPCSPSVLGLHSIFRWSLVPNPEIGNQRKSPPAKFRAEMGWMVPFVEDYLTGESNLRLIRLTPA